MAEIDPDLNIVNRPTHTEHGDEIPPLYAAFPPVDADTEAVHPRKPKSPGARRGSATEAAVSPEAEKEATES